MKIVLLAVLPILALAETIDQPLVSMPASSSETPCTGTASVRASVVCLNHEAAVLEHSGDFNAAVRLFEQANDAWKKDSSLDASLHSIILSNTGEAYQQLGRIADAAARFEQALTLQQSAGGDETRTASYMVRLASTKMLLGKGAEADALFDKGLAIERRRLPETATELSHALGSYALMKVQQGEMAPAVDLAKECVATGALAGTDTEDYAANLAILAAVYSVQGDRNRATPVLSHAIDIYQRKLGAEHPRIAPLLMNRSMLLAADKKYSLAEADASRAVDIIARGGPAAAVYAAWTKVRLCDIYLADGSVEKAEAILPDAVEQQRHAFTTPNLQLAASIRVLARLRAMQSRIAEAEALYRESISMFDAFAPGNPEAGRTMRDYAALLKQQKGSRTEIQRLESRARIILSFNNSSF